VGETWSARIPRRSEVAEIRTLTSEGRVVCERCTLARTPLARLKGLLGRRELPSGEGLLIEPTSGVHTAFMRFAIDVVFLDRDLRVLSVRPRVRPWRAAAQRGARAALELAAGEAERRGLAAGDSLRVE
jgi:uncharacterized protein